MITHINEQELCDRIALNKSRIFTGEEYGVDKVFSSSASVDWQGDMEGRALLALMSHYKIDGSISPRIEQIYSVYAEKTEGRLYFASKDSLNGFVSEQQLSGHSWLLRGLCEHYVAFRDEFSLKAIKRIVEELYLPVREKLYDYPQSREGISSGGVAGNVLDLVNGWRLSTDTGCAFMSIDGLSHAYEITGDVRIKTLVENMVDVFMGIDRVGIQTQTHCTLTAARGMLRMYRLTSEQKYLDSAVEIWHDYTQKGMSYTYQNLNWWGRPDSWTEPCAIVDSLMLSLELYKILADEKYRVMAARIYANGFATLQRDNGGAGTDTLVCENGKDILRMRSYEAWFCCSMRLSEGLWYIKENAVLLYTQANGTPVKHKNGVYMDGDIICVSVTDNLCEYADKSINVDGLELVPIVKYYAVPKAVIESSEQKVVFK